MYLHIKLNTFYKNIVKCKKYYIIRSCVNALIHKSEEEVCQRIKVL